MAKVGFNNLKAFGENLQKFLDKPIALVYGPNSSGKSSFFVRYAL
jgi:purine NTPase involved in DNA repair, rad50